MTGAGAGVEMIAPLVLAGLQCSPATLELLTEIDGRAPALVKPLLRVLADRTLVATARWSTVHLSCALPRDDVTAALLLLAGVAHLQVSGAALQGRLPPHLLDAARALPWWCMERVSGPRLVCWWELWQLRSVGGWMPGCPGE